MDITAQLTETLAAMQKEQSRLATAIAGVQQVLAALSGPVQRQAPTATFHAESEGSSYIDEAVTVLRAHGTPLHITILADKISERRGTKIVRGSLESSFIRHINKSKHPRLTKVGRSTYGLPEWKSESPILAQIA